MNLGESKQIFYFNSEGRQNLKKTVDLVVRRAKELGIKQIIVFTANGDGAFLLKEKLGIDSEIRVHAATFPYKQVFYSKDKNGNNVGSLAEMSIPEVRDKIKELGINLIQGVMPLQDIIVPGAKDVKTLTIHHTLSLISGGLRLCVQGILMAVDGGHIEPGEYIIAMSADTAIVARSCLSTWLFHPTDGLEINEIICKPNQFTIVHPKSEDNA
jgi:hypothetical protein